MAGNRTEQDAQAAASPKSIEHICDRITWADRWSHAVARLGYRREKRSVEPGLYSLGRPTKDSPVFVTANYILSFDSLRSALAGVDGYIMVLDTAGINVWCAAGGGILNTEEVVRRVEATQLRKVVDHQVLILPQLSASGVCAAEVEKRTGFKVQFGPVRAQDLQEYLKRGDATPEMRRVCFAFPDRLILVPVEIVHSLPYLLIASVILYLLGGIFSAAMVAAAILAGTALFAALLPWIPTRDFSSKGYVLGILVMIPFIAVMLTNDTEAPWLSVVNVASLVMIYSSVTAFLALNFTGSTTFTSRTGVRREIFRYIPIMAWTLVAGIALNIISGIALRGGS